MRLGELISPTQVSRCGNRELPILSITKQDGIVLQSEKFKKKVASADVSGYKVVPRGKLVQGIHIDEANFGIQDLVDEGIVSPAYKIWDVNEQLVLPEYLAAALRSECCIAYYRKNLSGTVHRRGRMSNEVFYALEINIPSLDEQRESMRALDGVLIDQRSFSAQLTKLDELVKSRFVEMFGAAHEMDRWPVCDVSEIANVTVGVVVKPAQYYVAEGEGIRAFRSLNIAPMRVKNDSWVYFSEEGNAKNKKSQLHAGDVVLVRSGAPGVACVVTPEYEGCNAVDIIIARLEKDLVDPVFFAAFMNFPHGQVQITDGTGGSAQQHFNVGTCKKMQFMLPPITLQQEFAAFVQQVDKLEFETQQAIDKLQMLYDSLAQEYFGGE